MFGRADGTTRVSAEHFTKVSSMSLVKCEGLLNLKKPVGASSRQAVDHVVRLLGKVKVGHAGTLDPLAEGVLVLAIGGATRLIEYVQRLPKVYRAVFLLGKKSITDDIEGEIEELRGSPIPELDQLRSAIARWTGTIQQRPPAYSAIKVKGERAYRLARQGETVVLPTRSVVVESMEIASYDYPRLELSIRCHSGTYVRALGRDIAESLGTAAVMSNLVRSAIGEFTIDSAAPLESLKTAADVVHHLQPPIAGLQAIPKVQFADDELTKLCHGQELAIDEHRIPSRQAAEIVAIDDQGRPKAVLIRTDRQWGPKRVFRWIDDA